MTDNPTDQPPRGPRPPLFPVWVWGVCFGVAGFAPGFFGDEVWAARVLSVSGLAGTGLGIACCCLRWARRGGPDSRATDLLAAIFPGAGLGLVGWLFSLAAWLALEIALGGQVGWPAQAVVGAAIGASLGCLAARATRPRPDGQPPRYRRWILGGVATVGLAVAAMFILLTGPEDIARYPPASDSPYRLPWPGGVTRLCVQGNRAVVSHRGWDEFAYDFAMPVGSDVCAARGGVVSWIDVEHDGNGFHAPNNVITIVHEDGTQAVYAHLQLHGSHVTPGQWVRQGDRIAASGNVGTTLLPHLHFHVTDPDGHVIPITFADAGVPRMFQRYTSGNTP